MRNTALALCSLLGAACASSPPVRYFVLDPVAPSAAAPPMAGPAVQIVAVRLPAVLDRRQIVSEVAANKLVISHDDRWGAPLPDMTQRVLSQDLMLRLPAAKSLLPEEPTPNGTSSITVEILQFGVVRGNVVLEGSWSVTRSGDDGSMQRHSFNLSQPAPVADYGGQAQGMSTLLGSLSDSMAQTLRVQGARQH